MAETQVYDIERHPHVVFYPPCSELGVGPGHGQQPFATLIVCILCLSIRSLNIYGFGHDIMCSQLAQIKNCVYSSEIAGCLLQRWHASTVV